MKPNFSFLLQASDDPSLMVGAPQVWARSKILDNVLKRRLQRPDEFLLGESKLLTK